MTLAKLTILVETGENEFGSSIQAKFNPNQITIQKGARWQLAPTNQRDVPASQFTHGEPATLTVDLFFDTYEQGEDVQTYTNQVFGLTTIEEHGHLHRPPICRLIWGRAFSFQGVLQNINARMTLFRSDGTPARATLTCIFREWRSDQEEERRLNLQSVDVAKRRVVRRGDTLSSLAGEEYNDPALWRPIAEQNGIDDPRTLSPGRVLSIPPLNPATRTTR